MYVYLIDEAFNGKKSSLLTLCILFILFVRLRLCTLLIVFPLDTLPPLPTLILCSFIIVGEILRGPMGNLFDNNECEG